MGRLMLSVLLSFAQFEREVTGERIHDEIAASKAKGMWMGGHPPLCPARVMAKHQTPMRAPPVLARRARKNPTGQGWVLELVVMGGLEPSTYGL